MAKSLLILTVLLSLSTAGVGYLNLQKSAELTEKNRSLDSSLSTAKSDASKLKKELASAQEKQATAQKEVDDLQAQIKATATNAEQAVAQVSQIDTQLKEKEDAIAKLKEELQAQTAKAEEMKSSSSTSSTPAQSNADVEAAIQEQKTLLEKTQSELAAANAKIADLSTSKTTKPSSSVADSAGSPFGSPSLPSSDLSLTPGKSTSSRPVNKNLQGQVLAVNQGWNFLVLNIGNRNGVTKNTEMLITRDDRLIGKARITSVEPSSSIADIVTNSVPRGMSVQPGDRIVFADAN